MNELNENIIETILQEYVDKFVPAMWHKNYHLTLVKGGPDYPHLSEQSHFTHIINGVFGLTQLVKFLVQNRVPVFRLNETTFRQALALFSIHEVHKATDYEKMDSREFSIPLDRLAEEYENLGLNDFATVDTYLMRHANVHKRSNKHGDMLLSGEDGAFLWLLVRLADTFASVKSPAEAVNSFSRYLKSLSPAFLPQGRLSKYHLYYHEIKDIRGILTNTIHTVTANYLQKSFGFFPLLYFATGTLYIGKTNLEEIDPIGAIDNIVSGILESLITFGGDADAIRYGLRRKKYDFEKFVFAYAGIQSLLEVIKDDTQTAKPNASTAIKEIKTLVAKRTELSEDWLENLEPNLGIQLLDQKEHKLFNEHWSLVRRYLLYVDTLLRDLMPAQNRLNWFLKHFDIAPHVAQNLQNEATIWGRGGIGKYVLVIAYHFLKGDTFVEQPAETLSSIKIIDKLHNHVLAQMAHLDTRAGRQQAVSELGFRQDLTVYLNETLYLSFAPQTQLTEDSFQSYKANKRKGHSNTLCSLCNRQSPFVQDLRTGILDDFGRIFSNRILPAPNAPSKNRPWCPICHLEFIFRKLSGLGLPSGAHYKNSYHIFLYVLPTYSFTPEHIQLFSRIFGKFNEPTSLPVRDYGKDDWGVPRYWLTRRTLDPDWVDSVLGILEKQADKIAGWGGHGFVGERIVSGATLEQPHYYLIKWAKSAKEKEKKDEKIATRTEAWTKALFVASIIASLTSCKLYVTERPYLPFADPNELKATITLDSPPSPLYGLLQNPRMPAINSHEISLYGQEQDKPSGLERALDLSAALWTVTTNVHAPNRNTKDKYIAERLSTLNANDLAGAHFYKEYSRLNNGDSPFSPLDIACQVLLDIQGGKMLHLVEEISEKALNLRLPFRGYGRGKIHNYELAFREGMNALRKGFPLIPELRQTAVTGEKPSAQTIAELKHLASGTLLKGMERRSVTGRGDGMINPWRDNLNELASQLIDVLVDKVYLQRAGGSFTQFLHLENALADGVYYYTDRNLPALWEKYNQEKAARKADKED